MLILTAKKASKVHSTTWGLICSGVICLVIFLQTKANTECNIFSCDMQTSLCRISAV